jgi:2-polyprenyl-6-methoxyphenol hydroxylase-like FAD-dependent oxidoreductase
MRIPLQRSKDSHDASPVHGSHAVVLGASISGLLAARVLSDHYDQVTLVERDRLAGDGSPRRGVPQARHVHALMSRGSQILEKMFPGLLRDLVESGVPVGQALHEYHYEVNGHVFFHDAGAVEALVGAMEMYEPSRLLLEAKILQRVRALPNVDLLDGWDVAGLTENSTLSRVTGARLVSRERSSVQRGLAADLVVAATGRSSRVPAWLRSMGYAPAPEEELAVGIKYVSQHVRFPADSVNLRAVLVGPRPQRPTGVAALEQEGGNWVVTCFGYAGHHPPLDRERWLAFADDLLPQAFGEALHDAEPLDDLHQHGFAANHRRRYDKLTRFPDGLLVTGDAMCSFNPIYGQGMTVAALEALCMREALQHGAEGLPRRFFKAAAEPVGEAWKLAVGADLSLPEQIVPGPRPRAARAANRYLDQVVATAEHDPVMAWRFFAVLGFEEPPSAFFAPDTLRRVSSDRRHHRRAGSSRLTAMGAEARVWP